MNAVLGVRRRGRVWPAAPNVDNRNLGGHMAGARPFVLAAFALTMVAGNLRAGPPAALDLNRATLEELLAFKGIGRLYAEKVIRGRPYKSRSELVRRNILPVPAYLAIKTSLYVSPVTDSEGSSRALEPTPAGSVDLNWATRDELAAVAGIGEAYADKIVRGRPYGQSLELVGRRILPLSTYERIASRLSVAGER